MHPRTKLTPINRAAQTGRQRIFLLVWSPSTPRVSALSPATATEIEGGIHMRNSSRYLPRFALAIFLLSAASVRAQTVLFSTFGPSQSF